MIQDIEKIAEIKEKSKIENSLEVTERLLKNGFVTPKFISDCTDLSISDIQTYDDLLHSDHYTKKDIDTLIDNIYKTKSHDIYKINPYHLMEYAENTGWISIKRKRLDVAVFQKTVINGDIENRYQINIPLDKDLLDYRSSMKAAILVIVEADNCTEEDLYQNITSTHNQYANSKKDENTRRDVDKLKTTDDYNWHSYGYIDSYPVKYRAEKSGEIYMVLSCMDGNISTVYHHPEILHRKIQNGQNGVFYDDDLKVAFHKLQSEYYYHLSKEIEFEIESEYFQKTNNERKEDVKQHAKNL